MSDSYTDYERAMAELLRRVGNDSSAYSDLLTYQQRLDENIKRTRRYGETGERKAERAEVIEQVNRISLSELNVEFNQLVKNQSQVPPNAAEAQGPEQTNDPSSNQADESSPGAQQGGPSAPPLPPTSSDSASPDSPLPLTSMFGIFLSLLVGSVWLFIERDFESLFMVLEAIIIAISYLAWRTRISRRYDRVIAATLCLLVVLPLAYMTFNRLSETDSAEESSPQTSTPQHIESRTQGVFVRNIQTGESISDAKVIITIEGEIFEGFTDSNGYVQLILPSNEGEINVVADGYQSNRQNLTFNNPQTIQLIPED